MPEHGSDDAPVLYLVPTELGRSDAFADLAALAGVALAAWWFAQRGVPLWLCFSPTLPIAFECLTGEAAEAVPFVGAIAQGLRAAFGHRRAHEWVLAWAHYFGVVVWPKITKRCGLYWKSSRRRIARWLVLLSVRTQPMRSRVSSWGLVIRYRLSRRLASWRRVLPGGSLRKSRAGGLPSYPAETQPSLNGALARFKNPSRE